MNVNEPSTFNHAELGPIVRLTQILLNVHSRVSSQKCTSELPPKASLDKLIFHLPSKSSVLGLKEECHRKGLALRGLNQKDKKYYLRVSKGRKSLDVLLGNPYNNEFWKVILNPKNFSGPREILDFVISVFGQSALASKIYRLDFAVDVFEKFEDILEGFLVENKTAHSEWVGSGSRTGLYIGANLDKFLVYNKGFKEKVDHEWTRIERQVSGSKVPVRLLSELLTAKQSLLDFAAFSSVHLNSVVFNNNNLSDESTVRLQELKTLIKHEGIFQAQKKLNSSKNFHRDYGKLFQLIPKKYQPKDIFSDFINDYFKESLWN